MNLRAFDLEDTLCWGVRIFRGLTESEARYQLKTIRDRSYDASTDQYFDHMTRMYHSWLTASLISREMARQLVEEGFEVEGLEEFEQVLEEGQAVVGNLSLEGDLLSIEELSTRVQPNNPDVERYGE